ncbi:RidA family protein [Desulfobotulus sp. H1]|uniref:RidA family protein n=1 Tax=Desulfobotulus pelophilus TaxID=2823377 RepID=A0ABT3N893_9BACT|nr:RidA family protein [Desulfobotulus pelophilus]MCW7753257.1 RidA family protein [Desulfobotulus pelophilus]
MKDQFVPESVCSEEAPAAIGPYSQAVTAGGLVFISGQLPLDPATGDFVEGDVAAHTHQCLKNLSAIARAAGTELNRAVKVTVFLTDMNDFAAVNEVYTRHFDKILPARSAVQVAALPKNARIEIEAILAR